MDKKPKTETTETIEKDSLGQPNPAWAMERDNIEKAKKRQEDAEKEAKSKES